MTTTSNRPVEPVQPSASPHDERVASTVVRPSLRATYRALAVPHPSPGTHPDGRGVTRTCDGPDSTWCSGTVWNLQYVLESTTSSCEPRWSRIVRPLSANETVTNLGAPFVDRVVEVVVATS